MASLDKECFFLLPPESGIFPFLEDSFSEFCFVPFYLTATPSEPAPLKEGKGNIRNAT